MFEDKENDSMNFDSLPDISFNSNGQPMTENNSNFPPMGNPTNNGQFIPPAGIGGLPDNENSHSINMINEISKEDPNARHEHKNDSFQDAGNGNTGLNMYVCNDCHTSFGVINGSRPKECIMCHGNSILDGENKEGYFQGMVPFSVNLNKAIEDYKSKVMLNPVIPIKFKSKETIGSIKRVYIPGYLYDTLTTGEVNFLGVDNTPSGNSKFDVTFKTSIDHQNVFYKSVSKIKEKVFNAIGNYKFNNITNYDVNNIGNCYFLASDVNKSDIDTKAEDNCKKHIIALARRKVNHQMKKVKDNFLTTKIDRDDLILVPTYFLNVRYGNKDYMYIMNGETGKSSLEVTSGKLEMIIFGAIIAAIVFGISVLVTMLI